MTIIIDKGECVGCGLCADICPRVYKLVGNTAIVIAMPLTPEDERLSREAAEACPVEAVEIKE